MTRVIGASVARLLFALAAMAALCVPGSAASNPAASNTGDTGMIPLVYDYSSAISSFAVGPSDSDFYRLGAFEDSLMLDDDLWLTAGFNVDVARMINGYGGAAFNGMFPYSAALRSPYLMRASGGGYAGVRLMLIDGLRVSFGRAFSQAGRNPYLLGSQYALWAMGGNMPYDPRDTGTTVAGLNWDFASWASVSLTASQSSERNGLGMGVANARTTSLGASARVGLGDGWVTTVSYAQANTRLRLSPMTTPFDTSLHNQSYGIAVAKQGLFGQDALGLSLSRPASNYRGTLNSDMQFQFYGRDKLFSGFMPETDIEVGYVTSFLDRSVALDVNASYQMNYQGHNKDELSFVSRAKVKF